MKNILPKIAYSLMLAAIVLPVIGFAATASIRATKSPTYLMGTAVPYYVYGYDIGVNAAGVATAATPPTAPKLPIAGGGGKVSLKRYNASIELIKSDAILGASEACDQTVCLYSAGANRPQVQTHNRSAE